MVAWKGTIPARFSANNNTSSGSASGPLPISFAAWSGRETRIIPIPIADDLEKASKEGTLSDLTLKVRFQGLRREDKIRISLNSKLVSDNVTSLLSERSGEQWLEWKLGPRQARRGVNHLSVTVSERQTDNLASLTLDQVHLGIRYKS